MSEPGEELNEENIASIYSEVLLSDREPIHPRSKYDTFTNIYDCNAKDIKFPKW